MDATNATALRKRFPPSAVGKLPKPFRKDSERGQCAECGGFHGLPAMHLDYVGHAAVTDRLLQVDPGWTWEPLGRDEFGLPAMDKGGNLWILLTVSGVTRIGVGDGASMKERIGDAIRNAAMRFGVALDLWTKEDLDLHDTTQGQVRNQPPPPTQDKPAETATVRMSRKAAESPADAMVTKPQLNKIGAAMGELQIKDRTIALQYVADVIGREVSSRNELTKSEASQVIEALEMDLREPEGES